MIHLCFADLIGAQNPAPQHQVGLGVTCELTHKYLELMRNKTAETNDRIFVVSHLTSQEKSKLNQTRLFQANKAFQMLGINLTKVLFLIGNRTTDKNGYLDFYVGSKFYLRVVGEKNKNICLICCEN